MFYRTVITKNYHWLILEFCCSRSLFAFIYAMLQSLKESRVVAMESFSIELIVHKCSKKKVFSKYLRNLQENTNTKIQLQIIRCNLANMPADIRPKVAQENCAFEVLNVICMPSTCPFYVFFFWDEVMSKKIQRPYRFWPPLFAKGFIKPGQKTSI